jgi:hypothetical protein
MPPANLLRLLPLLRREHRIELSPSTGNDGVQLGPHLPSHGSQLSSLTIHDGIDPLLLLGREPDLSGKAIPEVAIAGRMPSWSVIESLLERPWKKDQPVEGDSSQAAGQGNQKQQQYRE